MSRSAGALPVSIIHSIGTSDRRKVSAWCDVKNVDQNNEDQTRIHPGSRGPFLSEPSSDCLICHLNAPGGFVWTRALALHG